MVVGGVALAVMLDLVALMGAGTTNVAATTAPSVVPAPGVAWSASTSPRSEGAPIVVRRRVVVEGSTPTTSTRTRSVTTTSGS
ncbi:MAG: hypothetical protein EXQ71_12330 [Acidimicrobiia bacterium]|nr:hypothetical protein [Acidimicrobiia bacterium]